MKPEVTIILPVVRPKKAQRCIEYFRKHTGMPDDFWTELIAPDGSRIGCPLMVKYLVDKAETPWVLFLGDDTMAGPDFLKHAWEARKQLPDLWGLVALNDQFNRGEKLPTHFMGHKNLLPLLDGEFFHTGYHHCCCDKELGERCKALGRYAWAKEAVIFHEHPLLGCDVELDEFYSWAYSNRTHTEDLQLYARRKRLNFFADYLPNSGNRKG